MKVALVTDIMTFPGGAERLMMSMLKLYPDADIYTSAFLPQNYWPIKNKVYSGFKVGVLGKLLYKTRFGTRLLNSIITFFSPVIFDKFDLQKYDLVISFTARSAKGVISAPYATHINYILTPPRFEWDNDFSERIFRKRGINKYLSPFVADMYRIWDYYAVRRADIVVSLSKFIAEKIEKVYGIESKVIYPGISSFFSVELTEKEIKQAKTQLSQHFSVQDLAKEFFLVVSRLYDYKKVDQAITACIKNNKRLIVVGDGPDKKYLEKLVKKAKASQNIKIVGRLSDVSVKFLYNKAQALLFCGVEDFGLVPVEAMAQGCPVISNCIGGGAETVIAEKTGELFSNSEELLEIIAKFDKSRYITSNIIGQAEKFSEERFLSEFEKLIKSVTIKV